MIAKYVKDLSQVAGDAKLFALDEPLGGADYLAVSVINEPRWNQVTTQLLPSFKSGASWRGLDGTLSMVTDLPPVAGVPVSHDDALASLGYTADYTPWPEPEVTTKLVEATQDTAVSDPLGNVLMLTVGMQVQLPFAVADNLIAEGVAVEVDGEE